MLADVRVDPPQNYLTDVAHKHKLYKYARFNTTVEQAGWNDEILRWETTISIAGGKDAEFGSPYTIQSDFIVSAVGQLNMPRSLDVAGADSFQGKLMHSARWDWSYPLEGRKIAVIGTGSFSPYSSTCGRASDHD